MLACIRRLLVLLRNRFTAPALPEAALLPAILKELYQMSASFDNELMQLRSDIAAQGTVIASATAAIQGLATQLATAETAAKSAGATDEQIASLTALRQGLEANTATLAAAVPANTPAASSSSDTPTPAPADPAATPATAPATPVTTQG